MTKTPTKLRRMARELDASAAATKPAKQPSKLDQVERLLLAPSGASIAEIMAATCWQQHSVRGAMAGALKKRGLMIFPVNALEQGNRTDYDLREDWGRDAGQNGRGDRANW